MRLILIRHGQTPANVEGRLASAAPGPGLTDLGRSQAAAIPEALRDVPIDAIYVSTLVRTQFTAAPLADDRGLDVVVLPGIHEIAAGDLEDLTDHASIRTYLSTVFAWGSGDLSPVMPGSTDGHDFFARFDADIETIAHRTPGTAVVVSHGAAIRVWVAGRATNVPRSFAGDNDLHNTGIVELDGSPESGWTLVSWQGAPVGGTQLDDETAEDPTGETLSEVGGA